MYLELKARSYFSNDSTENHLTSSILSIQSLANGEHVIIVFTEQIPFPIQARPQAEFPSAASLRLNHFFPVIIPAVCSGKNKVLKRRTIK